MSDKLVKIGESLLQHGEFNNRIYLMKLAESDIEKVFSFISELLYENSYSKVFAKVPAKFESAFLEKGYSQEARIPGFYNGKEAAVFMCRYLTSERKELSSETEAQMQGVLEAAKNKTAIKNKPKPAADFSIRKLEKSDIEKLAEMYRQVFPSYPFPIHDTDYLRKTMEDNVIYFGVFENDKLAAASSAEMDTTSQNVEMTDFATDSDFTGNGLALVLLDVMEDVMREKGMKTFYTIARAMSYGMNITFSKAGYTYSGTLINNTNISGQIESMNIWFKPAAKIY
jgi:putative beta-lysine N-acetyltransferase